MSHSSKTVENILHRIHCGENGNRVIFLDVDGVIANTGNHLLKVAANKDKLIREADMFVPSCLRALKDLVTIMDAKIVISSSWRKLDETLQPLLLKLAKYEIPVIGITPSLRSGRRDDEITDYMKQHGIKPSNVLILDDSETDLTVIHHRLFRVNGKFGFRRTDIPKAIAVFCGNESSHLVDRRTLIDMIEKLSACDKLSKSNKIGEQCSDESITTARCIAIALSTYLPNSRNSRDSSNCQPRLSYMNWFISFEIYRFESR